MADPAHLTVLRQGVQSWNRWRDRTNHAPVDLRDAPLAGAKLDGADLLHADLRGADLTRAQLERAHLTRADLTGAVLEHANLEHVIARHARFDDVRGDDVHFEVATLRNASFRDAVLTAARFHRAYLRDATLTGAHLANAVLRFAVLENAQCQGTDFSGADLHYASVVDSDLSGAQLVGVQAYGISAWGVRIDERTRQDLIVSVDRAEGTVPLHTNDLGTAQLLALMLDGAGVRRVLDSATSKLVLVLGSFAPDDKAVLDRLRAALQAHGYVAVTFDFERPAARDYAETVLVLAGMSRFVVADFTNAREVRSEVLEVRRQYPRLPVVPTARAGADLPDTLLNSFSAEELDLLVRYESERDLEGKLQGSVLEPAEQRATEVAEGLARLQGRLRGS